jgi:dTDP-4-amino-4,6-dideoxygalactose transaminase
MTEIAGFDRIEVSDADVEAVLDCLSSGWLTMGPRIQAFEKAFSERVSLEHAIAVSSGEVGVHLSLLGLGVGRGDEVLVPGAGTGRIADSVRSTGAEPVAVDVRSVADPVIDPAAAEAAIGSRTRAVVVSHTLGHAGPVDDLLALCEAHAIPVFEDATDAFGTSLADGRLAGTAGALGCFDLSVGSQLPIGEGGMVVTGDEGIAARVRSLRSHAMTSVTWDRHRGHADSYDVVDIGFNFRMDEPRAALGLSRLERYDAELARRRALAAAWREALSGFELVWDGSALDADAPLGVGVVFDHVGARDGALAALASAGIGARALAAERVELPPNAAEATERVLVLPLGESVGEEQVSAGAAALSA